MAYVNFPTYLETRHQGLGEQPQRPVIVQTPKADDTSKTLLFLGIGLALGYFLLKSGEEKTEKKNPHQYIPIKSFKALMDEFGRGVGKAQDGADGDKILEKAIEKVRVKNPDDFAGLDLPTEKVEEKTDDAIETTAEHVTEKNPYGGGKAELVIIKKVAKNKYYGIFKRVDHQHKRGRIVSKKTYSVELLDHKDQPLEDQTNRFWLTSLPKAKSYIKELKGAI